MANVNAQSVEDYADRIVYRYAGGRFEQAASLCTTVFSTGLKTLVNTDTSRSYIIPASGISARFFKIDWTFNTFAVFVNNSGAGTINTKVDFARIVASSLNYDGKAQQTIFIENQVENFYTSPQLRAINIGNIQMEPKMPAFGTFNLTYESNSLNSYLVAIVQPVVTFYKK